MASFSSRSPGTFLVVPIPPLVFHFLFLIYESYIEHQKGRFHVLETHSLHILHTLLPNDIMSWRVCLIHWEHTNFEMAI